MDETRTSDPWIPVQRPLLPTGDDILPYLRTVDQTRLYSNHGPLVRTLEERLSEYFAVPADQLAVFSSGTTALEAAVATAPSDRRSVWHVPSWTFTATASAVIRAGAQIRFVDIDDEWRIPPEVAIDSAVDVLPFGAPPCVERIPTTRAPLVIDETSPREAHADHPAVR